MNYAFRDRALSGDEFEAIRLILSTFRDGGGQVVREQGTMPGFRDFERAVAAVTYGYAREDKGIFDVWVPTRTKPFGISCKMSSMQPLANKASFMELSNSAAKFHAALQDAGIDWMQQPRDGGALVVDLVSSWHFDVADEVDIAASRYAVLAHDRHWEKFQLLAFPLDLSIADPWSEVEWLHEGRALNGYIFDGERRHRLWSWYPNSGGQLKYYPLLTWAEWSSDPFELENAPLASLRSRAIDYFPDRWPRFMPEEPNRPEVL